MAKLTQEQIKFIDDYLFNAGVHYIDIRCEMIDHVATALEEKEGDFGQNFFAFMASHKIELMASNKSFEAKALSNAGKMFLANYKQPAFLLATIAFIALVFFMTRIVGYNEVNDAFLLVSVAIHFVFYSLWIYFWIYRKNRYSVIDRLLMMSFFLPMLFKFEETLENKTFVLILLSVYTSLEFTLIYTVLQIQRRYKLRYNG